jgi:hypothetical protein
VGPFVWRATRSAWGRSTSIGHRIAVGPRAGAMLVARRRPVGRTSGVGVGAVVIAARSLSATTLGSARERSSPARSAASTLRRRRCRRSRRAHDGARQGRPRRTRAQPNFWKVSRPSLTLKPCGLDWLDCIRSPVPVQCSHLIAVCCHGERPPRCSRPRSRDCRDRQSGGSSKIENPRSAGRNVRDNTVTTPRPRFGHIYVTAR